MRRSRPAIPNAARVDLSRLLTPANRGTVTASGGTKSDNCLLARQVAAGSTEGSSRKSLTMSLTQSSKNATPWLATGSTRTVLRVSPAAAASANRGGVIGSNRPARSKVGMSLITGSSTVGGNCSTCHRAQASM